MAQAATFFVAGVYSVDAVIDVVRDQRGHGLRFSHAPRKPRAPRPPRPVPEWDRNVLHRNANGTPVIYYDANGVFHWD